MVVICIRSPKRFANDLGNNASILVERQRANSRVKRREINEQKSFDLVKLIRSLPKTEGAQNPNVLNNEVWTVVHTCPNM